MTHYATCLRCKRKSDCTIKDALSKAIKGLGITSVRHRCDEHEPIFSKGDPVWVRFMVQIDWDYEGDPTEWADAHFPGWFIQVPRTSEDRRPIVYVEPGAIPREGGHDVFQPHKDGNNGYCKAAWARLAPRETTDIFELEVCE